MTDPPHTHPNGVEYSSAWAVAAEGARIGIVTCRTCGAALVLDLDIDVLDLHTRWHQEAPVVSGFSEALDARADETHRSHQ